MNENRALVSIVMPAYNAELYIGQAIESVLNQTFENLELLVIDDGSTDSTANIVRSFSDDRIILIQQENGGVSVARNAGLNVSKGKYITFLDADDILPPRSLEVRVEYLEFYADIDLVDGNIVIKDADIGKDVRTYVPYYSGLLLPRLMALDSSVFFNVCYMFKREMLGDVRFKEKMTHAEDLLFYIELVSKKQIVYGYVKDEVYWYRSGHTSAMTNLTGLGNGYLQLIQEIKKLENRSKTDFFIFKTKIAKIMFLSWLKEHKIVNAFSSINKILWL